jgi:membrane protein required for colicin V production
MIIDIIVFLIIIFAIYTGFTKGIIHSVMGFFAIIMGFIIAMNFSSFLSVWLSKQMDIPEIIMPILSFILIIIMTILAFKLVAYLSEKVLKTIKLNFLNKFAGATLWTIISILLCSVLLFFISKTGLLGPNITKDSHAYKHLLSMGSPTIHLFESFIPYFKESFHLLNNSVKELPNS